MTTEPPGWYDDGHGGMRWWDGRQWTEHVAVPRTAEPPLTDPVPSASPYWGGEPAADQPEPVATLAPSESADPPDPVATVPPSDPRRPRPWIPWVVFGAVGLGLVLAFAFGSQLVLPKGETAPGEAIEEPAAEDLTTDQPETPDEQAAVDTVELYNEAWLTSDCEDYFASTTAELRSGLELPDCDSFIAYSKDFADGVEGFETIIRSVTTFGVMISVSTTETYSSTYDDGPVEYEDRWEYDLLRSDTGGWAIDNVIEE